MLVALYQIRHEFLQNVGHIKKNKHETQLHGIFRELQRTVNSLMLTFFNFLNMRKEKLPVAKFWLCSHILNSLNNFAVNIVFFISKISKVTFDSPSTQTSSVGGITHVITDKHNFAFIIHELVKSNYQ